MANYSAYKITGGKSAKGEITAMAAKNAFGKQLVACLLTKEPVIFSNAPRIKETTAILDMLDDVGCKHEWTPEGQLKVDASNIRNTSISERYSGFNRIPILMVAPLLHRTGEISVPMVGGCKIGPRPVDYHLAALADMGALISETPSGFHASAKRLKGAVIQLPYPSVGATENILMAGVLAKGTTVIKNAAVEPEIIDTIEFLQKMGAVIQVDVDRTIVIEGVDELGGAKHATVPDRIEAASFAALAVATGGDILVRGAQQGTMISFLNMLRKIGGGFEVSEAGIRFFRRLDKLRPVQMETDVHPGFMTDWQQPTVVLLTQADGISIVHETVYEERFGYTSYLKEMGANIQLSKSCLSGKSCRFANRGYDHSCIINGATPLFGRDVTIPDLRAGFAYLVAAAAASGVSAVKGIHYIERGYERAIEKLLSVGVQVEVLEKV